ncbi:AAA domain-containing protein [Rhodococcus hoagii]|nr:AAA domain-containing protein [Prescottella equi]MBM4592074.1 AAA domain-containing protein [Prescottella equi]MBM4592667.1 AAA domain-containing protein [Prescottella equi]
MTSNPSEAAALDALRTLIGSPQIDRAEVERIAREVIGEVVFPTKTVVISDRDTREIEGNTHAKLADVILTLGIGEHAMMVGPAGTGKSTIAEQAAEALGLESYAISLSPQTPASQILGYMQATGDYVPSLFREAFENGGVFHFDEFDNGNPSILGVINAALANSRMAFPDGMVKRHDDFRCVASANTFGRGANRTYVGKNPIDASTLDRFSVIEIDIDEALESALCKANAASDADAAKVLDFVRKLRKNADKNGLNVVISPRAAVGMCRLLKAGMGWDDAVNARARRGVDDSTWNKLTA